MKKLKLAIISSHPIQYNAPMFELLAKSESIEPKVFYTWSQSSDSLYDKDFGKEIKWDIPLLNGYDFDFVKNVSANPGPGSYKGIDCPELNHTIQQWGADALLIFGWNYKAHFSAMKFFKGKIPVYFRGDSTLLDETKSIKIFLRRLTLTWVYKYIDGAFYVGQNNKAYFLKHGLRENELSFAPHAIDIQRFSDENNAYQQSADTWRKELAIPQQAIVILFVGKFEAKKNPVLLLRAFVACNQPDVHLVFVGNGILENEMRTLAANAKNIHFLPFQNQSKMPVVYHLANILALPSQGPGETWGLVVNEAMACKKAILVSDKVGCAVDLVENERNGFIFTSGNYENCKSAINKMITNKHKLTEMGEFSYRKIQSWSFSEIVKSIENKLITNQ
ncbi:MAG: glycosyltransferase family 4 protein [Lentimicrobiaceae bacterium]|nr:glycosyltransferase family 4 protein [Lentimicrobiaceae bacterium]MCB9023398.1 glycosyltransferase family 4 protein [Lentimicrobiaceae bacterium]MCO5265938.1 glycosyltransferase family 4 protein [Lentimicrobium sp.]